MRDEFDPEKAALAPGSFGRRPILHMGVGLMVAVVCMMLIGLDLWRTRQAMLVDFVQSQVVSRSLARVLAEQTYDIIHSVEIVLSGLRGRIETEDLSGDAAGVLRPVVQMRLRENPIIRELYVQSGEGRLVLGATSSETDGDFAGSLLSAHRSRFDSRAFIGAPVQDPTDGTWMLSVSQRIAGPDGHFGGIVVATIALCDLQSLFEPVNVGSQGIISLLTVNSLILARKVGLLSSEAACNEPVMGRINVREDGATIAYTSALDGVKRIGATARVGEYGLTVIVAPARDEILAGWWYDAKLHFLVCLGIASVLCVLGAWLVAQVAARAKAERHYRLLAENSNDGIVSFGLDGALLYVSPAFAGLIGRSVAECAGINMDEIVHPADRLAYMPVDGEVRLGSACFRYVGKDGSHRWVEGSTRLATEDASAGPYYVASIRDVSERKAAERRIEALNSELATLASTDGLTGVANRRRFDEMLEQEWRRSAREETPLSLLLLDVDHFKSFNDCHGHIRGDECLRTVAGALARSARRPGDFVARYGGEEFVVLLPNTDAAGAGALAEMARAGIEAIGIEHGGGGAGRVVTCSVGFATVYPRPADGRCRPEHLFGRADAALYAAKRAGRNRVAAGVAPGDAEVGGGRAEAAAV